MTPDDRRTNQRLVATSASEYEQGRFPGVRRRDRGEQQRSRAVCATERWRDPAQGQPSSDGDLTNAITLGEGESVGGPRRQSDPVRSRCSPARQTTDALERQTARIARCAQQAGQDLLTQITDEVVAQTFKPKEATQRY